MNWITKFIKPKIKSLFEKKSSKDEENLWTTCGCKNLIYTNITNIKLTADSNGGGAVTEIKGNDKFFIKQDQGFKLITEFVIVSE